MVDYISVMRVLKTLSVPMLWVAADGYSATRHKAPTRVLFTYSLIETCKANDINPEAYYRYILYRIAEADTVQNWEALLPWNVKAALQKNSAKK